MKVMQKKLHLLIAMMVFLVSSAMAQVTTSSLSGKVTLEGSGEEVIGATVQAVHVPSGTKYAAITNTKGVYSIQGMRAGGPYTVIVSYIGAKTKEFNQVSLNLGETYNLQVWLSEDAKQLGEVDVIGMSGLNASRNGAAESISGDRIRELPSMNHSVADIVKINPFVKVTEGGAMYFAGSNNRYNAIQIDGAMSNDVFGLTANGANGGQAGTQSFSMETIDQLQVSIAPFDVRQSGFTGGAVNAITKSGTNEFHGSAYSYFQNGNMVGNKYEMHDKKKDPDDYGNMTDWTWGATLGGPIVKDKLFFFANFERVKREYDNVYSSPGGMSKVDFTEAQKIYDFVKSAAAAQGVNYTGTLGTPKEYTYSDKAGLKLDWNINERNHASLRWSLVDAKQNNKTSAAKSLVTNDYAYDFVSKTNSLVFQLNSRIGENMNNEFHASWVSVRDKRNPGNPFPMISVNNVGKQRGSLSIGNERSSMANALNQDIYTFTDNFGLSLGNHNITIGTHNEFYKFGNLFCQDLNGTYYFNSPEDLYSFNLKRFRYGQGVQSVVGTNRWVAEFSSGQLGFYVQDKWNVTDRLNVTYGIRADLPIMFDTPVENTVFNSWAASKGYDFKTNQKISVKPMFSPRLGFRWNIDEKNRIVLRGGVGVFTGRIPYVWLSNSFSNTGVQQLSYDSNSNKKNLPNIKFILDPSKVGQNLPVGADGAPTFAAQTVNVFDKDFKFSQQLRADLALDLIDPLGIKWTLEGIYSKTLNDMVVKKMNIESEGKTWAEHYGLNVGDNRPMFTNMPNTATVYYLTNVSKGYSYSFSARAEKNFDFGLDLMASYTYGKSMTINNGSSSVAASNWQYNYTHDNPNESKLEKSNFNVPHQVTISAYEHFKWNKNVGRTIDNITTIGLIYTGNSGSPYSVFVDGDVNGDGGFNDLMYIHTDSEIDALVAAGMMQGKQAENYKVWLANEKYLKDHRGEFFDRNADNENWENRLDLHVDHKFGFKWGKDIRYIQIGLDVLNFTNMLNKKWGATLSQYGYKYYSPLSFSKGKYVFKQEGDYDMRTWDDYYSRWRMQFTAKLIF